MGQWEPVQCPNYLRCWIAAGTALERYRGSRLHGLFDEFVQQLWRHFAQLQLGRSLGRIKVVLHEALIHAPVVLAQRRDLDLSLRHQPHSRARPQRLAILEPHHCGLRCPSDGADEMRLLVQVDDLRGRLDVHVQHGRYRHLHLHLFAAL